MNVEHPRADNRSLVLSYVSPVLSGIAALIASVMLVQWLSGSIQSSAATMTAVPMAPMTALLFLFVVTGLMLVRRIRTTVVPLVLIRTLLFILLLGGLYDLFQSMTPFKLQNIEQFLVPSAISASGFIIGRMSDITAIFFVLMLVVLLLQTFRKDEHPVLSKISDILSVGVFIGAVMILSGYWYGAPLFYGGTTIPVAVYTAICFGLVSSAQLFNRPENFFYRLLTSSSVTAQISRLIIPTMVVVLLAAGYLEENIRERISPSMYAVLAVAATFTVLGLVGLLMGIVARKIDNDIIRTEEKLKDSEKRYRRLFETAQDAILILNGDTGQIIDANPFIKDLLGLSIEELLGKNLWEIGEFKDALASKISYEELHESGYKRWDNLPLVAKDGRIISVEVVANAYQVDHTQVIQCNIRDMTKANSASEALRQSEACLIATLDSTNDGILAVDNNGKVIISNRRFAEMWHIPPNLIELHDDDALLSYVLDQLVEPEIFTQKVKQLYREDFRDVDTLQFKDGRIFERYSRPLILDNASSGRVWSFRDITERKKSEIALLRSAEEWRNTFDSITDLISIHGRDRQIIRVNKAFAAAFNTTPEALIGKHCYELVHGTDTPPAYCPHLKTLNQKAPSFTEQFEPNLNKWLYISTSPIFNESGEVIATVHATKDITERKKAEEALILNAERHRAILKTAMDGVWRVSIEGRLTEVNDSYCGMSGYSEKELLTMSVSDLEVIDSPGDIKTRIQKVVTKGQDRFVTNHRRKDGSIFDVEISIKYQTYDGGSFIVFIHDITEHNKLMEQLMAQDRLASIGQLVSGVAHEINNPMTSVIGFSELLLEKELPPDIKADIEIINSEAKRTTKIVQNLLTFARQHSEGKALMNIQENIDRVLALRNHEQTVNNIQVNTRFVSHLPQIMANSSQLQQVFFNLIINAEQAMLQVHNKGTITISTERVGDSIKVSIADDGPGISQENMKRLFTPFFTTKEVGKGTGLGLSISHGIIKDHGGKIYAKSEPGKGATFVVEIPINTKEFEIG